MATGGPGGGSSPSLPPLPSGWSFEKIVFTILGLTVMLPIANAIKRKYIDKPQPEKVVDAVAESSPPSSKSKSAVGKAASAVKHATVDPIRDTLAAGVQAVKHSDTGRTVQLKVEDTKDKLDLNVHDASNKTERGVSKTKQEIKHAAEHTKAKLSDTATTVDSKGQDIKAKTGRAVQRGKEKVTDVAHDVEAAAGKTGKGLLESIKGAATTVGRKLHVVADATEKGAKKAADKAERALGVKHAATPTTDTTDRKAAYYTAAGVATGAGVLAALYFWDRSGGDIAGKVRRLQDKTKEATDKMSGKTKEAVGRAKDALQRTNEPAGPKGANAPNTAGTFGPQQ